MTLLGTYGRVLQESDFRRYFIGESVSSVGDAMSEVTIVILALTLVPGGFKPMAIAFASAAYLVPGIVTGSLVGRHLRGVRPRTLLVIDNCWRGLVLGIAALLVVSHNLNLVGYVALLGLASLTRPLGAAGSRALIVELAESRLLFAANSLVGSVVQAASMLGPALAGVLIALIGAGAALGIDALSFLFFVVALLLIPPGAAAMKAQYGEHVERSTTAKGVKWLLRYRSVAGLFGLTAVFYALYGPFVVGLPLLAAERGGNLPAATVLGFLWSAFGVGAVIGGLLAGNRASLANARVAALISVGWGVATVFVALPTHVLVAVGAMFFGGLVYAPYSAIVSTVMQRQLPPDRLNQASAYYSSITNSAGPAGILAGGLVAVAIGPSITMLAAGGLLVTAGLCAAWLLRTDDHTAAVPDPVVQPG